jgi:hypothetical protein
MQIGIHFPNRPLTGNEIDRMVNLGGHDYLVYDAPPYGRDWGYWKRQIEILKSLDPSAKVHLRLENRGNLPSFADAVAQIEAAWNEIGTLADTYRFGNEPDLERPGLAPNDYIDWMVNLAVELATHGLGLFLRERLYMPALSGGASAEWFRQHEMLLGDELTYFGWDAHCYGSAGEFETQLAKYRSRYDGPLLITEFNYGPGSGRLYNNWHDAELPLITSAAMRNNASGLIYFIWEWHQADMDTWLTAANVATNNKLRDKIMELNQGSLPAPSPQPLLTPEPTEDAVDTEKIREYSVWSLARIQKGEDPRDVWAFIAHLEALNADPTRPYDYGLPYRFETVPFVRGGSY